MISKDPVINIENLSVSLEGYPVLEGVSLQIGRGLLVGLIGPNGAGKTTLLKSILGLVPPDKGRITVLGRPITHLGDLRDRVGYVPQNCRFDRRFPVSALDVALMGCLTRGRVGRRVCQGDKLAAERALGDVGMASHRFVPMGSLSGGEQQRVFLARALVRNPEVLLLDEPGTALDVASRDRLYRILAEMKKERRVTTVVVAHDLGTVLSHADEVVCVNRVVHMHEKTQDLLGNRFIQSRRCDMELWEGFIQGRVMQR